MEEFNIKFMPQNKMVRVPRGADLLSSAIKCGIILIGIQPKSLTVGKSVSKEVKEVVKGISYAIIEAAKGKR